MSPLTAIAIVHRHLEAPAESVFDAWLDPIALGGWMFGPAVREEEIVSLELDPHVGGRFSFQVRRNGQMIDHVGEYRAIDRPRQLIFTWGLVGQAGESQVAVEIVPGETGVDLTLEHAMPAEYQNFIPQAAAAWDKMLTALDRWLHSPE